jgi:hypothetical protein
MTKDGKYILQGALINVYEICEDLMFPRQYCSWASFTNNDHQNKIIKKFLGKIFFNKGSINWLT